MINALQLSEISGTYIAWILTKTPLSRSMLDVIMAKNIIFWRKQVLFKLVHVPVWYWTSLLIESLTQWLCLECLCFVGEVLLGRQRMGRLHTATACHTGRDCWYVHSLVILSAKIIILWSLRILLLILKHVFCTCLFWFKIKT